MLSSRLRPVNLETWLQVPMYGARRPFCTYQTRTARNRSQKYLCGANAMLSEAKQMSRVRDVGSALRPRALLPDTIAHGRTYTADVGLQSEPSPINTIFKWRTSTNQPMSSISSTSTLASWDPMTLFSLMNPDKLAITCVGYAPSCRRRCRNQIAFHNIQAAKAVMRQLVRPGVSDRDLKEMLFNLAEYTLCRKPHQHQATEVSERWFRLVQRNRDDEEEDRFSDTSDDDHSDSDSDDGASSSSSSDDDSDAAAQRANNGAREELRRRLAELENLQREFDELLRTQRQSLRSRVPASTSPLASPTRQLRANPQASSETARRSNDTRRQRHEEEQEALRAAQQVRQEEAYRTAQQERAAAREQLRRERAEQVRRGEARLKCEAQLKREAEVKAERLRQERVEKARLERERKAKEQEQKQKQKQKDQQQQQSSLLSWESAWTRYEAAWNDISITNVNANDKLDIRSYQIWPTKCGSFVSCSEEDVRAFFRCQPGDGGRRMLRRQALRWHPDRAARLFAGVADEVVVGEMLKTVTLISQVVIGIMGVTSR
jgi:hypothetical protein